ncbi:MAG: hypothetical protein NXH75_12255 [Halobacteriovoraceae bacterium]|nr:hypothetical protein [Halobacteriovoraceae bacterium]
MRPIVWILSLTSLLFIESSFSAEKVKCFSKGKFKVIENNKPKILKKSFCINQYHHRVISYSCIEDSKCEALTKYKGKRGLLMEYSSMGTPMDRKCFYLKGKPLLLEYFDGKEWKPDNVCFFSDKSFISVANSL